MSGQIWSMPVQVWAILGQMWPKLGPGWPSSVNFGRSRAKTCRIWLMSGPVWSNSDQFWTILGHVWPQSGDLVDVGPNMVDWPNLAELGPCWSNSGHFGAIAGPHWPTSDKFGSRLAELEPKFGRVWGELGPNSPKPGPNGPLFEKLHLALSGTLLDQSSVVHRLIFFFISKNHLGRPARGGIPTPFDVRVNIFSILFCFSILPAICVEGAQRKECEVKTKRGQQ